MEQEQPDVGRERVARTQATIYDIAKLTGVSPSTVSRALSKPGRININTEQRIRDAAESIGYRINPMARALHTGRTQTLGLILSDITNPVYFDLVRGAERVASQHHFTLVLAESQESRDVENEIVERLIPSVDGLVLVASRLDDDSIRDVALRKPITLVNRSIDGIPSIVPDPSPGIRAALDHLRACGHQTVAFLAGPEASWMSRLRWNVVFEEAVARGMSVLEIGPGIPTLAGGEQSLRRALASGATAVIAYNDLMAIGLLTQCQRDGVQVPGRLSIVGFDDIFGASFTAPPLTTISSPLDEAGARAAVDLIRALDSGESPEAGSLDTTFVERASTGRPSA